MFRDLINDLPQILESRIIPRLSEITLEETYDLVKIREINSIIVELGIVGDIIEYFINLMEEKKSIIEIIRTDGQNDQVTNDK